MMLTIKEDKYGNCLHADKMLKILLDNYGFNVLKLEISPAWGMSGIHREPRLDDESFAPIFEEINKKTAKGGFFC